MPRQPLIGITCSEIRGRGQPPRQGQNRAYLDSLVRAGAIPVLIPHFSQIEMVRALYDLCDGLLLPGGGDIDPSRYGEPPHPECRGASPQRDEIEIALARWAMEEGRPLLGICRGIQLLNVALGGSLYQDIASQLPQAVKHDGSPGTPRSHVSHFVSALAGSRLAELEGEGPFAVNSLHHQAVNKVAPGLRETAWASDGVVEAVEAPQHPFALAVQWHPEELAPSDARAQRLFDALVAACQTG